MAGTSDVATRMCAFVHSTMHDSAYDTFGSTVLAVHTVHSTRQCMAVMAAAHITRLSIAAADWSERLLRMLRDSSSDLSSRILIWREPSATSCSTSANVAACLIAALSGWNIHSLLVVATTSHASTVIQQVKGRATVNFTED